MVSNEVLHALSYPFQIPSNSFILKDNSVYSVKQNGDILQRTGFPVLAAGSNQSVEQLARKYSDLIDVGEIFAERGLLYNFDTVYAADVTAYGSVPATFQASPGTSVKVFLLWLSENQLLRMHETEKNYFFDRLLNIEVKTEFGIILHEAYAYSSRNGCLNYNGKPIALAEIPALDFCFSRVYQKRAQEILRDRVIPKVSLNQFVTININNAAKRGDCVNIIKKDAIPLQFERELVAELK